MWIFGLFFLVPLIEIALFVTVGGWLTLWPTLAIVLATAVIGAFLVRYQGIGVLRELQQAGDQMKNPLSPLAHGALILIGGFLLMLPGFFTDTLGFLLMIPALRRLLIGLLASRVTIAGFTSSQSSGRFRGETAHPSKTGSQDWIDADFEEIPPKTGQVPPPSGWTRH